MSPIKHVGRHITFMHKNPVVIPIHTTYARHAECSIRIKAENLRRNLHENLMACVQCACSIYIERDVVVLMDLCRQQTKFYTIKTVLRLDFFMGIQWLQKEAIIKYVRVHKWYVYDNPMAIFCIMFYTRYATYRNTIHAHAECTAQCAHTHRHYRFTVFIRWTENIELPICTHGRWNCIMMPRMFTE